MGFINLVYIYFWVFSDIQYFCVLGGNTKREQGRKVQESNVAAAKVSDNKCMLYRVRRYFHFDIIFTEIVARFTVT